MFSFDPTNCVWKRKEKFFGLCHSFESWWSSIYSISKSFKGSEKSRRKQRIATKHNATPTFLSTVSFYLGLLITQMRMHFERKARFRYRIIFISFVGQQNEKSCATLDSRTAQNVSENETCAGRKSVPVATCGNIRFQVFVCSSVCEKACSVEFGEF